jgi:hypothetical protein
MTSSPRPSVTLSEQLADVCRRTLDFDDVLTLAHSSAPGFRLVTHDARNNIRMYTAPVEASPIHMMKASVTMPCAPEAFLRYLDFDVRCMWDEHFIEGAVIRKFSDREVKDLQKRLLLDTPSKISEKTSPPLRSNSPTKSVVSSTTWKAPVTLQLKHVGFLTPVPLLADRDFELVVAESFDEQSGVAILKALSPPVGSVYAANSNKYVRGVISLSGFIVTPVRYVDPVLGRDVSGCSVTYIALVHPMGMIPSALVNIVVGKQTAGLQQLQTFMRQNPIATLPPKAAELATSRVLRSRPSTGAPWRKSKL